MGGFGGRSSGGSDNDVSGNEAVYSGGQTYSSRQTKSVNQNIADTNRANRESRKGIIQKIAENSLAGRVAKKVSGSKFVQDTNYEKRMKFAKDKGLDTSKFSRDFVLSKDFKNQLDYYGYSEQPDNVGGGGNDNQGIQLANQSGSMASDAQASAVASAPAGPTNIEMAQEDSEKQRLLRINRRGRRATILNVPEEDLTLSKKTLLG